LVPGKVLTIGSQNLTRYGASESRFEASAVITDQKVVKKAEADVTKWTRWRTKVTEEWLDELAPTVRRLRRAIKKHKLRKQAKDAKRTALKNQRVRQAKLKNPPPRPDVRKVTPPEPHKRRHLIKARLNKIKKRGGAIQCRIYPDGT